MKRLTKKDKEKIEKVRKRKDRILGKVKGILQDLCDDNKDIFKKAPEVRLKSFNSIVEKMKNTKECDIRNFEQHIKDIAGARVTCCTLDEINKAEHLIKIHPEIRSCEILRKYDDPPDEYGYRGHHLKVTVRISYENETIEDICEVQIRTLAGDLWAVLSHRDFYRSPDEPPPPVQNDMRLLSKQLEVVDGLALSLKQRRRDELNKEAREKAKKKHAEKDMLTPENVINLVSKTLKQDISIDLAYNQIQKALSKNVISLKEYKTLILKSRPLIEEIFQTAGVKPRVDDYLDGSILIKSLGKKLASKILRIRANILYNRTMASVEKGVDISKEELKKEIKTSQPTQRKKKR